MSLNINLVFNHKVTPESNVHKGNLSPRYIVLPCTVEPIKYSRRMTSQEH